MLLEDARVTAVSSAAGAGEEEPTEVVSMLAEKITWTDEVNSTTHSYNFNNP